MSRVASLLPAAALVAALLSLGAAGDAMAGLTRPPERSEALSSAGWEGRRLLAQFLWLKTHAVIHAGIEERQALPGEEVTRAGESHRHGGGEGHGSVFVTVIPPRREDFRGILGDMERAIRPYVGAKGQTYSKDTDQTIPFYRLMTWADPHFIQGYTIGASVISRAGRYADRGIEFLREGERYNPDSFEIQTELGRFYLVYKKDYAQAEEHLRRAVALIPRGRKLTELEEDARTDAYRWRALNFVEGGRPAEAVRAAAEGLRVLGSDTALRHILQRKGRR